MFTNDGKENVVGKLVYRPYRPTVVGVIKETRTKLSAPFPNGTRLTIVEHLVRWLTGKKQDEEVWTNELDLSDFEELIADHRKKLATHEALLKKVKSVIARQREEK